MQNSKRNNLEDKGLLFPNEHYLNFSVFLPVWLSSMGLFQGARLVLYGKALNCVLFLEKVCFQALLRYLFGPEWVWNFIMNMTETYCKMILPGNFWVRVWAWEKDVLLFLMGIGNTLSVLAMGIRSFFLKMLTSGCVLILLWYLLLKTVKETFFIIRESLRKNIIEGLSSIMKEIIRNTLK